MMDKMTSSPITHNCYFTPGRIAVSGLEIKGCGYMLKTDPDSWVKSRTLDTHALVYYTGGNGWFESESCKKRPINAGNAIFLFPDERHSYGPADNEFLEEYWFLYNGAVPSFFYRPGLTKQHPVVDVGLPPYFVSLCKQAVSMCRDKEHDSHLPGRMVGLLFQILFEINKLSLGPAGFSKSHEQILEIIESVRKAPDREYDFRKLAKSIDVSYSLLRKRITDVTGKSPVRFLNEQRISMASKFLAEGLPIKKVCFSIGMRDPYYFSRMYKKITGKSPRDFYKSIIAWDTTRSKKRKAMNK